MTKLNLSCKSINISNSSFFPVSSIFKLMSEINGDDLLKRQFRRRFPNEIDLKIFLDSAKTGAVTRAEESRFDFLLKEIRNFDERHFQCFYTRLYDIMLNLMRIASLKGIYAKLNVVVFFKNRKKSRLVGYFMRTPPYGILVDRECTDLWIMLIVGNSEEEIMLISENIIMTNCVTKVSIFFKFNAK